MNKIQNMQEQSRVYKKKRERKKKHFFFFLSLKKNVDMWRKYARCDGCLERKIFFLHRTTKKQCTHFYVRKKIYFFLLNIIYSVNKLIQFNIKFFFQYQCP